MTAARWNLRPFDPDKVQALSREAGVPPLIAQLLLNRGVSDAGGIGRFFDKKLNGLHDPETLPGVVDAADRIVRAIRAGRKIVIYGDYDADGVCGTSILWSCLKLAGAKDVAYYIPHRVEEGYGVNADALRRIATEMHASMVVTVDCGISAVQEARLARELGIEFIITDHHTIGPDLPGADVLVHPRLPGSRYPFGDLCGCAVAFKLAWQICKSFGDGKKASPHLRDFLIESISLVAMATIADVMPIHDENRLMVRHGLRSLAESPSHGLRALLEVSGQLGKKGYSSGTISFGLAPRINAAGRLERAMHAVEMLTTGDPARAGELASLLDACNKQRQEVEKGIVDRARAIVDEQGGATGKGAIVVGEVGWHPGVVGIVASRLVELYHRPSVVVALGESHGQGSARTVEGFDLYQAIRACSAGLTHFGGHPAAAGLRMPVGHFRAFAELFEEHCQSTLSVEQRTKQINVDAEVMLGSLSLKVVEAIESLEPHGIGNPRPTLVANGVRLVGDPKFVGKDAATVQLRFCQGNATLDAVAFKSAERAKHWKAGMVGSVAFQAGINDWNGRKTVQMEIKEFRIDEASARVQSA